MNTFTKLKDQTLTLPKNWIGREVFIKKSNNFIILKKIEKPLLKLSDLASQISSPKMSEKEIQKEIQNYRKSK